MPITSNPAAGGGEIVKRITTAHRAAVMVGYIYMRCGTRDSGLDQNRSCLPRHSRSDFQGSNMQLMFSFVGLLIGTLLAGCGVSSLFDVGGGQPLAGKPVNEVQDRYVAAGGHCYPIATNRIECDMRDCKGCRVKYHPIRITFDTRTFEVIKVE